MFHRLSFSAIQVASFSTNDQSELTINFSELYYHIRNITSELSIVALRFMAVKDCPLPGVAEALNPYIKPREEVARIRQELQTYLEKQLKPTDAPVSSVTLAEPHGIQASETSSALSGVRKAYLGALQAHATAQARYDALKEELDQVSASDGGSDLKSLSSSVKDSYIPLLRQRERQRKLQVIDQAFTRINAAGKRPTNGRLDEIVRQRAGELPTPPMAPAPAFNEKPDVGDRVLQLKEAVLATKRRIDDLAAPLPPDVTTGSGPGTQTAGLQDALNELTGWMEQQLAIIGEAEAEPQATSPVKTTNGHATPEVARIEDIEALYEQYLVARQQLIQTVNKPQASNIPADATTMSESSTGMECEKRSTPAETLLPYIQMITAQKQEEQSLMQQSTHLRRQIATSEAETARLIARLANESHLVHPGAGRGKDWAEAASDASRGTGQYARQRLQAGGVSAEAAKKALQEIEGLPKMLDALPRDPSR